MIKLVYFKNLIMLSSSFKFQFFITITILLSFINSCEPPDCDFNDCGTCGNACCRMEVLMRKFSMK